MAALLALLLACNARAAEIRVVTEAWPPYSYTERGVIQGVVSEIVKATLDRTDLEYTIKIYPWARAYDMARGNENVLIYTIFKLPNRAEQFKWIKLDGLGVDMHLFNPKHRTDIDVDCLEDAKKYKIGVTRETSTHHYLLSKGFEEGVNLFPVNSEDQNALKSTPGSQRIDLTTGDRLSLYHWLSMAGLPSDYWTPCLTLFHENFYMAFGGKTSDSVVEKVRNAFNEVKESGELQAIVDSYYRLFDDESQRKTSPETD